MDKIYMAALQIVPGLGSGKIQLLIKHFCSAKQAWQADRRDLFLSNILNENNIDQLIAFRSNFDIHKFIVKLEQLGISISTYQDDNYPCLLKKTYQPPAVLYYCGQLPQTDRIIAIVGSRNASDYGINCARFLARELAKRGIWVVSGGARGIDSAAHHGALETGSTVSVFGCGVDIFYPPENKNLFKKITDSGSLISEYPPGMTPKPYSFPARNRIISGMSQGVIIVEAAEKSGALITADQALEEGRDVFCVPGSIFSKTSKGTNRLIQQGAKLITSVEDICQDYGWQPQQDDISLNLTIEEKKIYDKLELDHSLHLEEIIIQSKLPADKVCYILLQLELRGLILNQGGNNYLRMAREEIK